MKELYLRGNAGSLWTGNWPHPSDCCFWRLLFYYYGQWDRNTWSEHKQVSRIEMVLQRKRHLPDMFKELRVTLGPPSFLFSRSQGDSVVVVVIARLTVSNKNNEGGNTISENSKHVITVAQASRTERSSAVPRGRCLADVYPVSHGRWTPHSNTYLYCHLVDALCYCGCR